jgi:hypothetical protein
MTNAPTEAPQRKDPDNSVDIDISAGNLGAALTTC